jgi:LuxR family maltose regulon positive regulatory protein
MFRKYLAIVRAVALHELGDGQAALEALAYALREAAESGRMAMFTGIGPPMVALLRRAIAAGVEPIAARRILDRLYEDAQRRGGVLGIMGRDEAPTQTLPDPLTERELQILRLLAVGLTSRAIAEQLIMSVATARTHVRNIYRKLDVHSREEAVEWADGLGLL